MQVHMEFYYFKIEGLDRSSNDLKIFVRMPAEKKPKICDVISFVADQCDKINEFSYMTGPVEITESEFVLHVLRPDELVYVFDETGPNEVSSDRALICEGDNDYVLKPDRTSVWIAIDNMSLYIMRTEDGVNISAMPLGSEMDSEINIGSITRAEVNAAKTRAQK